MTLPALVWWSGGLFFKMIQLLDCMKTAEWYGCLIRPNPILRLTKWRFLNVYPLCWFAVNFKKLQSSKHQIRLIIVSQPVCLQAKILPYFFLSTYITSCSVISEWNLRVSVWYRNWNYEFECDLELAVETLSVMVNLISHLPNVCMIIKLIHTSI